MMPASLVAGSRDKTVKLWRNKGPAAWVVSHTLAGHSDWVRSARRPWRLYSYLILHVCVHVCACMHVCTYVRMQTLAHTHSLVATHTQVNCVTSLAPAAQSKDSALIVSGSRDKTLRLWVQDEGGGEGWRGAAVLRAAELGEERGHSDFVTSAALTRRGGGALLASGGADWQVILWDVEHGANTGPLTSLCGHSYAVRCVAFQSAGAASMMAGGCGPVAGGKVGVCGSDGGGGQMGHMLASGSDDETVRVWDPRAKYGGKLQTLQCGSAVLCCCWGGGDMGWLAAGGGTGL